MKKFIALFVLLLVSVAAISIAAFSDDALKTFTYQGITISGYDIEENTDFKIVDIYNNDYGIEAHNSIAILTDKKMTISGTAVNEWRIWVASPDGANLTFSDLTIKLFRGVLYDPNRRGNFNPAVGVASTVPFVNITLEGTNDLESGPGHAGLENNIVPLEITGTGNGSLTASGYKGGAGIGGGRGKDGKNITINIKDGFTITAESTYGEVDKKVIGNKYELLEPADYGGGGAGIGGGKRINGIGGEAENITINAKSGTLNATGRGGAGIGGGEGGSGKSITIDGGKGEKDKYYSTAAVINACGTREPNKYHAGGAGIGGGLYGDGEKITINGCTVNADSINTGNGGLSPDHFGGAGIGGGCGGNASDITITDSIINIDVPGSFYTGAGIGGGCRGDRCNAQKGDHTNNSGGNCTGIKIYGKAIINSEGGTGAAGIGGGTGGSCDGIEINLDGGEIIAQGSHGACIGGGDGGDGINITISGSGTVNATGSDGAGIGGGKNGEGKTINISGTVKVSATSSSGAGIGGGKEGKGSGIEIAIDNPPNTVDPAAIDINTLDAYVKATSQNGGAGIGGGNGADGSGITLKSGYIEAKATSGAGIGGGVVSPVYGFSQTYSGGNGSYITIEGGIIKAETGSGAGIGGGSSTAGPSYSCGGSNIEITGGNITATSNGSGAGIGGGTSGSAEEIKIAGDAQVKSTGGAAGIGGGQFQGTGGNASGIEISGNAKVEATGKSGAGIGSSNGIASGITISGNAEVNATGLQGGAGIGSGMRGSAEDIEISGNATVNASGQGGAGVGSGASGSCKNITISGGTVTTSTIGNPGISGTNVEIKGKDKESYPLVYTNAIDSGNGDSDYYGIVFNEAHKSDYDKPVNPDNPNTVFPADGVVYGGSEGDKTIVLNKEITLKEGEILRVQEGTTFVIPGVEEGEDKLLTLEPGSTLYLEKDAKLNTYENIKNDGEIKHYNDSEYDTSTGLCTICGSIGTHKFAEPDTNKSTWDFNVSCHWHRCEETKDCSIFEKVVNTCNLLNVHNNEEYGHSDHILGEPTRDGNTLTYACKTCYYSYKVEIPQITVNKTDNEATPQPLSGARFGLYNNAGCAESNKITEATSADNGKAVFNTQIDLDTTYYIKEIEAPADYKKSDTKYTVIITAEAPEPDETTSYAGNSEPPYKPVTINGTAAYSNADSRISLGNELSVKNTKIASEPVKIIKTDDKGAALAGAEFSIYRDENCTDRITTGTTAIVDGVAAVSFDTTLNSTYYIKETKAPNGYTASDKVYKAVVGADGTVTYNVVGSVLTSKDIPVYKNYPVVVIPDKAKIIKVESVTKKPLAGAEFSIYSDAGCTGLITTGTTAIDNGEASVSFTTELNHTYYIKETKAPEGYELSNNIYKAVVGADGKVTYGDGGSTKIPLCENKKSAVNEEPDPVDPPSSSIIKLIKVDSDTKNPLVGAQFGIYSDADCITQTATATTAIDTDKASDTYNKAVVSFTGELGNTYYIKETKAPDGYTASDKIYKAEVGADGKVTYGTVGSDDTSAAIPVCENKKTASETPTTPTNPTKPPRPSGGGGGTGGTVFGTVMIIKVDGATGAPLANANFGIYSDEECTELIMTETAAIDSDNKAVVSFTVERNNTYYIKETKAPSGYKASDKVFKAIVDADGKVTYGAAGSEITSEDIPICENEKTDFPPSKIKIIKVDSATKNPLAGARFGLYGDEKCTERLLTGITEINAFGNAAVSFTVDRNRTYYIKEIEAPSGYTVSDKVFKAVAEADGRVIYGTVGSEITSEVTPICENKKSDIPPSSIKIIKVDSATKKPLSGAWFGLYGDEKCTELITTGTTAIDADNNAVVSFAAERNKTYYIKEIEAPDGYKASDKVLKAIVDADGKVTYGAAGSDITSEDIPICENEKADIDNKPAPDDEDNPKTGIVPGIVRFVIMNGVICTVFLAKGARVRRKRKNSDDDEIDL